MPRPISTRDVPGTPSGAPTLSYNRTVVQVPYPVGYLRWPRRRRLLLETSIGIVAIAAVVIGALGGVPLWLQAFGWALWVFWMIFISVVYVRLWSSRRHTRH